jgi:hypothetical protein
MRTPLIINVLLFWFRIKYIYNFNKYSYSCTRIYCYIYNKVVIYQKISSAYIIINTDLWWLTLTHEKLIHLPKGRIFSGDAKKKIWPHDGLDSTSLSSYTDKYLHGNCNVLLPLRCTCAFHRLFVNTARGTRVIPVTKISVDRVQLCIRTIYNIVHRGNIL